MTDIVIFGFGLAVTTFVGSALTALIVAKNRAYEKEDRQEHPTGGVGDSARKVDSSTVSPHSATR